ncbi:MAG: glutaredoxin 3 [Pseudomonadota bacterium]
MTQVEIYTSPICGFCVRAKRLLDAKGVTYAEHDVFQTPGARAEMVQRADGRSTVPQIFIGGAGIGGCDELHALERAGKLDALLAA